MFYKLVWQTYAGCGGIFNNPFTANLLENQAVEEFENRLRFDRYITSVDAVHTHTHTRLTALFPGLPG